MAAEEARASWQRTANHCFVQQDAKRAPKLACCSSSCTTCNDSAKENPVNAKGQPTTNCVCLNWSPTNPNLSPGTISWLQLQPNFSYQKENTYENLKFLQNETNKEVLPTNKLATEPFDFIDFDRKKDEDLLERPWMVSTALMNQNSKTRIEMQSTSCNFEKPLSAIVDSGDYFPDVEQEMKQLNWLTPNISEKTALNMGLPLLEGKKSKPWWCVTEKDELALFVGQKSADFTGNCDLPEPTQVKHACVGAFSCPVISEANRNSTSYVQGKSCTGICSSNDNSHNPFVSSNLNGKNCSYDKDGSHLNHSENTFRTISCSSDQHVLETSQLGSNFMNFSECRRSDLLEALCHSQTRARKAEIAAQQAYDEREDLIKLLFRQASHLFAYKQWLHILQLENLCLKLKIKNHQISTVIPALPWMPLKLPNKGKNNIKKSQKQNKPIINKYAIFFAVGIGLASMGFLVSSILGRLLPAF